MSLVSIFLIALSLSMDAFSVAVSSCICTKNVPWKIALKFGIFFGGFQFLMPVLGAFTAGSFLERFMSYSNIISLVLLGIIGGKMIHESFTREDYKESCEVKNARTLSIIPLSIATSIDAFAVGVTFRLEGVNVMFSAIVIGIVTFIMSTIGAKYASKLNFKPETAERLGGAVLIGIGLKMFFF